MGDEEAVVIGMLREFGGNWRWTRARFLDD